ncbi:osmoprotectant transport system ATP-binding protein [Brevibacterium sanguinis]|uniref:ABC-type quaternary amine transporter n=2 Tax=Brevibacterium TaxID=1696 RepID=A0A366IK05_9MICO|nr:MULTISPECIES: ATP-binding cassette domain-containing protein [Brevibacterium]RBP66091.1 osmoprotectant transport system ATP-binding protein [Brevibacterium sanguinis]RBP72742.1 osmoprotectant transport system ATP-binding protein [Brevibacterium celere]
MTESPNTTTTTISTKRSAPSTVRSTKNSSIVFDNVTKTYPGQSTHALDSLSLEVASGELVCLVGPSGGGKTTALQLVNRLVDLTSGEIRIGDTDIKALSPIELRRTIGYAIQQSGLFPHCTVAENIAIVPTILKWDRKRIEERTKELLELVGLTPIETWLGRYPGQLSGGQQQRVGIARALAADPPVMLMDEPFGALDPITRAAVQDEFLEIHRAVGKTTLFVTHDIDEAIKMADRIAILKPGGLLAQYDTPAAVLARPADDFVAEFLGAERGLKRLALTTVAEVLIDSQARRNGSSTRSESGANSRTEASPAADWPEVAATMTLREALSVVSAAHAQGARVMDAGNHLGDVTLHELVCPPSDELGRQSEGAGV